MLWASVLFKSLDSNQDFLLFLVRLLARHPHRAAYKRETNQKLKPRVRLWNAGNARRTTRFDWCFRPAASEDGRLQWNAGNDRLARRGIRNDIG